MSITIRNEFKISNGHQILSLVERNKFISNEILASRTEDFIVKRSLNLRSLNRKVFHIKHTVAARPSAARVRRIIEERILS